jgi:hypothetical protein
MWGVRGGCEYPPLTHIQSMHAGFSFSYLLVAEAASFDKKELCRSDPHGDIRSSRFANGVIDTGGKWKNSSIRKILIILFGHLWVVEETYI